MRGCLQFQQHSAAALFAQKGAVVAAAHHADFYKAQLDAQRAIALALAGGGASSTGAAVAGAVGQPSPGAVAAVEAQQGGDKKEEADAKEEGAKGKGGKGGKKEAVPVSLFKVGEVRALLEATKSGLEAERAQLPKVFEGLVSLNVVDAKVIADKVEPLVAASSVPDVAELPALSDFMYPTQAPQHLPRGAVSVGGEEEAGEGEQQQKGASGRANGGGVRVGGGRGGKGGKGRGKK